MVKRPFVPDDHRRRPLEPPENAEVRDTLEDRRFRKQLVSKSSRLAAWIVGIGAMVAAFRDTIIKAVAWIFGGHPS